MKKAILLLMLAGSGGSMQAAQQAARFVGDLFCNYLTLFRAPTTQNPLLDYSMSLEELYSRVISNLLFLTTTAQGHDSLLVTQQDKMLIVRCETRLNNYLDKVIKTYEENEFKTRHTKQEIIALLSCNEEKSREILTPLLYRTNELSAKIRDALKLKKLHEESFDEIEFEHAIEYAFSTDCITFHLDKDTSYEGIYYNRAKDKEEQEEEAAYKIT